MAFLDQAALTRDDIFRERVRVAMLAAAAGIQSEPGATANHNNRAAYATRVLNAPDSYVGLFAGAAAAVAGSKASDSDAVLQAAVSGLWDAMAGVI